MFTGSLLISVFSFYSLYCEQYEWYLFTAENSLSLLIFLVDVWFLLHLGSLFIYSKPVIYLFTFLGTFWEFTQSDSGDGWKQTSAPLSYPSSLEAALNMCKGWDVHIFQVSLILKQLFLLCFFCFSLTFFHSCPGSLVSELLRQRWQHFLHYFPSSISFLWLIICPSTSAGPSGETPDTLDPGAI